MSKTTFNLKFAIKELTQWPSKLLKESYGKYYRKKIYDKTEILKYIREKYHIDNINLSEK